MALKLIGAEEGEERTPRSNSFLQEDMPLPVNLQLQEQYCTHAVVCGPA